MPEEVPLELYSVQRQQAPRTGQEMLASWRNGDVFTELDGVELWTLGRCDELGVTMVNLHYGDRSITLRRGEGGWDRA